MTSAEHHDPAAASAGDEREVERHGNVPMPRKRAVSSDAVGEWEAKRTRSPRPSVASPVLSPPTARAAEQARRSEEWACTHVLSGLAPARDSQWEDALLATLVGLPRADGRGDSQAEPLAVESTPLVKVRGRGSWPRSSPCPMGPSSLGQGFRVIPLSSWYAPFCLFSILLLVFFGV